MTEEQKVTKNIINLITVYKLDKQHDAIWLEAQIINQLQHYKQWIEKQYEKGNVR